MRYLAIESTHNDLFTIGAINKYITTIQKGGLKFLIHDYEHGEKFNR